MKFKTLIENAKEKKLFYIEFDLDGKHEKKYVAGNFIHDAIEKLENHYKGHEVKIKRYGFDQDTYDLGDADIKEDNVSGAVAGFNGPMSAFKPATKSKFKEWGEVGEPEFNYRKNRNVVREDMKTFRSLIENTQDLSKIPSSSTHWLEQHFDNINRIYKDKEKTLQLLQQMPTGEGISKNWANNFINTVKHLYNQGPDKVLKYVYDCYLKGSKLGITESKSKYEKKNI